MVEGDVTGAAHSEISVPSRHLPAAKITYLGTGGSAGVSWEHEARGHVTKSEYQELAEFIALRFEAFRSQVAAGFQDVRELFSTSHLALDRRVTRLEEGQRG